MQTVEVSDEPPAAVGIQLSDFELTIEAVPATVIDLVGRGLVDVEDHGPDKTVLRLRRQPPGERELPPL